MSADTPSKPTPFNPGWLTPALVVLTGIISGSVSTALNSRDVEDLRNFRAQQERWNASIEKRLAADQLDNGKTLVALQKDVETMTKAVDSIRQALMVRPTTTYASPTP